MDILRITFVDYVDEIDLKNHPVCRALSKKYNLIVDNKRPQLAICDMWGCGHIDINIPKVYCSLETYIFDNDFYDVYIGGVDLGKDKIQNNFIANDKKFPQLQHNKYDTKISKFRKKTKTKFCAFLYKNYHARERIQFCKKLMKYKSVDCLGAVLNNVKSPKNKGRHEKDWQSQQIDIYSDYKFVIAFENKSLNGYVCEKISAPLYAGAIPIYWGADDVNDYINPECFINVKDFNNFAEAIEYIKKVDNDDKLYQKYINAKPILPNSKLNDLTSEKTDKKILNAVQKILNKNYIQVGRLTGYNRLKAMWISKYWKYKQSMLYRFEILLEIIGIK